MKESNFIIEKIEDYNKIINAIKYKVKNNIYIFLYGDLGAGKTAFSKEFINYFTDIDNVTSPTFNILQIYENEKYIIYHYDLYRLKDSSELFEIDIFEENYDSKKTKITLIEWPEIAENLFLDKEVVKIKIDIIEEEKRNIVIF